jgi:2-oxoglutarate ferredoxin oxidoreductase subunit alpha
MTGTGSIALLCFGSSSAPAREAANLLAELGVDTRVISLRLLAPLQNIALLSALTGCAQVVVVEQNHSRQLFHYLKGHIDFQQEVHSYAIPGPVPLRSGSIAQHVLEVSR